MTAHSRLQSQVVAVVSALLRHFQSLNTNKQGLRASTRPSVRCAHKGKEGGKEREENQMKNKLEISTNGVSTREDLEKEHKPDTKE